MAKSLFGCALLMVLPVVASAVLIDLVTVGDPGNSTNTGSVGSVGYNYEIGTFEVMNSQYVEFLNSVAATDTYGLYQPMMGFSAWGGITRSGSNGSYTYSVKANMGDKPVNYVSFYDAVRFVNWLENGQPTGSQGPGTTETGTYSLFTDGGSTTNASSRDPGAGWVLPTNDEWYKAAYYDPTASGTSNYWLYPTRSDDVPIMALVDATGNITNGGFNVANYDSGADWNGQDGNVTTVGSAGPDSASYYGTFDQGGNVQEWNETVVNTNRMLRGGGFWTYELAMRSSILAISSPLSEGFNLGFRVAFVPEPGPVVALTFFGIASCLWGRHTRRKGSVIGNCNPEE